ncbi:uncharacterized protein LOC127285909 [Leptopilina boulardi]|uniref:uncharacterized protein LOC127285909 n=1 Tax=Leptopilina boulardi TaxID=63433 RepID=UPI0021F5B5E6|nr:uncharacterized protein LOC127285909 [Leptopilina boulardi]XP_051168077.1 uncharacterized protein LOC127285909 [Leptopilina boulardi]XP_051168078.1 uncharacterized protein LOC127285909 [Leptopilina boulardi]XP_051168080.1 uncharacterized protein LOC127285909 [Leptopilina boulardi]XP_051168081.1 uncharacterized protein LOC127285909 [Leptopilina boulardi]
MLRRLFDPSRSLLLATILCVIRRSVASPFENKTGPNDSRSRIFSPRMDYDEWTPLGRGDPLKNDPTFDYVPPVLDRVQYWLDSHTTEPSAKRDILILGVTAKKTSPKLPEHFLKFIDAPKFNRNKESIYRNDFTGSTGAEPPKLMRNNNFRNPPMDFRNQNKIQSIPASYYPSPFYNQKSKPYTVMMPPPLNQKILNEAQNPYGNHLKDKIIFAEQFSTQTEEGPTLQDYNHPPKTFSQGQPFRSTFPHVSPVPLKPKQPMIIPQIENIFTSSQIPNRFEATTPSISFEKSNLVYQSTQTLSGGWIGSSRPTSSIPPVEVNQITWKTPDRYEIDHHGSASVNHEVVIGQNANIIVDGDNIDNEEVVIGQKETTSSKISTQEDFLPTRPSNIESTKSDTEFVKHSEITSTKQIDKLPSTNESTKFSKTHIVVANSPSSVDVENRKVSVVMPTNYNNRKQTPNSTEATTVALNHHKQLSTKQNSLPPNQNSQISTFGQNSKPFVFQTMFTNSLGPITGSSTNSMGQTNFVLQKTKVQDKKSQDNDYRETSMIVSSPESINMDFISQPSMERPAQVSKPQPFRNSISSPMMPLFIDTQTVHPPNLPPSKRMPPTRHTPFKNSFGESINHQQPRPIIMMHRFRPSQPQPPKIPMMPEHIKHQDQNQKHPNFMNQDFVKQYHKNQDFHHQNQFISPLAISTPTLQMTPNKDLTTMPSPIFTPTTHGPFDDDNFRNQSPLIQLLNNEEIQNMEIGSSTVNDQTVSSLQTTTVPSLTTDPLFSHYKQPAKPIRGPMYLIIQGHSKVKTYKPTVNKYGFPVANEIFDTTTKRIQTKYEKLINNNNKATIRDIGGMKKKIDERSEIRGGTKNLLSFIENGLSAFTVFPPPATEEERQANSVTTIEINGN